MPMNPRLLRPRASGLNFDPRVIKDCAVWLDASDLSTLAQNSAGTTAVTANNDPVGYWKDRVAGYTVTQTVADANRPLWLASGIGGRPALSFDGTNDFLSATSGAVLDVARDTPGITLMCVVRPLAVPGAASFDQIVFFQRNGATTSRANIGMNNAQAQTGGRRLDGDSFSSVNSSNNVSTSTNYIFSSTLDYSAGVARVFLNGTLSNTNSSFHSGGNTQDTASNHFIVGAQDNAATNSLNGPLGEVLVFRRVLSDAELSVVHRYLRLKYSI